jgi:hypothetical protein
MRTKIRLKTNEIKCWEIKEQIKKKAIKKWGLNLEKK